ncbi:hypothetical protein FK004_12630 [Flavobacterium kingsejongi]|uniref:Uncharacterized protein n=2 Tax=Flavobacterium kingsejongi TaxID=1678728 RepID=A0A2S1LQP1_9FLAO|nr:hypothetical protein FK004_12630 [Flavobacterium kingsejongi]
MNSMFPFKGKLTEVEAEILKPILDKMTLTASDQEMIIKSYCKVYQVKNFNPCTSCPGVWKGIIKKLKKSI